VATLEELHGQGFYVIALEQNDTSVDYKTVNISERNLVAFVIGPEVTGMTQEVLDTCDVIAEIPMFGTKESLNVTIAFGIGVYRILGL
jgi:tRNA G18 (ribose-2'-O)-methylase SpoU